MIMSTLVGKSAINSSVLTILLRYTYRYRVGSSGRQIANYTAFEVIRLIARGTKSRQSLAQQFNYESKRAVSSNSQLIRVCTSLDALSFCCLSCGGDSRDVFDVLLSLSIVLFDKTRQKMDWKFHFCVLGSTLFYSYNTCILVQLIMGSSTKKNCFVVISSTRENMGHVFFFFAPDIFN